MNARIRNLMIGAAALSMLTWTAPAQDAQAAGEPAVVQAEQQVQTQRRKRVRAMRDANGDGICDVTGQPVGSRAGQGQGKALQKRQGKRQGQAGMGPGQGGGNRKGRSFKGGQGCPKGFSGGQRRGGRRG